MNDNKDKVPGKFPKLADLKGIAPDLTDGLSPAEFVRKIRNEGMEEILKPIRDRLEVDKRTAGGAVDYQWRYNKMIRAIKETLSLADKEGQK
jgi:hypothetical protein